MITLTLKKEVVTTYDFKEYTYPAGAKGRIIDVMIENNGAEISFLLDFDDLPPEWIDVENIEDKY